MQSVHIQMSNEKHVVIFRCDLRWCNTVTSAVLSRYFRYVPFWSYFLLLLRQFYNLRVDVVFIIFYSNYATTNVFSSWKFDFIFLKSQNFWPFLFFIFIFYKFKK